MPGPRYGFGDFAHGVTFHHFHGGAHPRIQGSIDAEQLSGLIDFLGRDRILDADEWMKRHERRALSDGDLCLTFDDNLRCQFDVALPVLEHHGIQAFWFVPSFPLEGKAEPLEIFRYFRNEAFACIDDYYDAFWGELLRSEHRELAVTGREHFAHSDHLKDLAFYSERDREYRFLRDRVLGPRRYGEVVSSLMARSGYEVARVARRVWMDESCLRRLAARGQRLGLHSHTHPTRLQDLSFDEQYQEYARNGEWLTRYQAGAASAMAHPCSSYDQRTLQVLSELGVRLGFTARRRLVKDSPLEVPREDHANLLRAWQEAA